MDIKIGQDSGAGCNKIAYLDENLNIVEKLIPSLAKLGKATVSMTQNTGITYFCEGEEWSFNPDLTNTEDTRIGSYPYEHLEYRPFCSCPERGGLFLFRFLACWLWYSFKPLLCWCQHQQGQRR